MYMRKANRNPASAPATRTSLHRWCPLHLPVGLIGSRKLRRRISAGGSWYEKSHLDTTGRRCGRFGVEAGRMRMSCRIKLFQRSRYPARRRMHGAGSIKTLLLIPVGLVLLLLLAVAFFEGRKAYWDYRVREMCEKDGGTHVFEQVLITRQDAQANGLLVGNDVVIPSRPDPHSMKSYYIDYESTYLRTGAPSVFRARTAVVRARDMKIMAEMIGYTRVGGDAPTFAHPSSMSCPDADQALIEFRTAVQIKEEPK